MSVEYDSAAFRGLKSLVSLNLAYNNIETIHPAVFRHLSSLTTLEMSGNLIKTLPQNPFKHVRKLKHLNFNTSELLCDCHLQWMPDFLKTLPLSSSKFTCGFPENHLQGRKIFQLQKWDLECDVDPDGNPDSLTPVLSKVPANGTVFLYGRNMTLECVAEFLSSPGAVQKPSFTWTKNRKVVEPFYIKTKVTVNEGDNNIRMVSQLYIDNVSHDHAGNYQCIARNSYGPSYSPPAHIIVHRFPYFVKKPTNVTVKEGGVVEIQCSALGFPEPEIRLIKDGPVFSAPQENRMHFSDSTYFIKPALPRDAGLYICVAGNAAGAANVTAMVSVMYTPKFTRIAKNLAAFIGQSIALECQVRFVSLFWTLILFEYINYVHYERIQIYA